MNSEQDTRAKAYREFLCGRRNNYGGKSLKFLNNTSGSCSSTQTIPDILVCSVIVRSIKISVACKAAFKAKSYADICVEGIADVGAFKDSEIINIILSFSIN